jgi:hypothetical protein
MLRLVSAWVLVNGLLMAPSWLSAAVTDASATPWLSLEAALIVGVMALLPRTPWSRALAWIVAAAVVLVAAVSFADVVFRVSLGRPLDLSVDLYLLNAVYRLAVGNSGLVRTVLGIAGITVLLTGSVLLAAWLLQPRDADDDRPVLGRPASRLALGMGAGALALALLGLGVGWVGQRFVVPSGSLLLEQAAFFRETRTERLAFAAELESEPGRYADVPGLFSRLGGRHVVLSYVESYGMAALEDPEFAAVVGPRLEAVQAAVEGAGLHMVSGRLTSPTLGGQSWYAHGSMISGLWLENQLRYELLLASDRETLVDDFRRAGYRTATVMPAITTAWPEAVRLGYDDVYTAENIPYAGPPFYWVTMPDQFTWSFVGRVLREASDPLFVEAGMVSSHAPWTPVLPLLDAEAVGDGSIFEPYRLDGYPPEEIWWDVAVLREGYARSIGYSLAAMADFAARSLDERTLLLVVGDHQAAPWVTGASGADVPVHVVAADEALLRLFLEWGFEPGAFPDAKAPARPMDDFRGWFVRAFSGAGPTP